MFLLFLEPLACFAFRSSTWLHGTESGGPISSTASLHTCFSSTTPTAHSTPARTISAHLGSNLQMRNPGSINISASNRTGRIGSDSASQPPAFGPMVINGSTCQLSARLGGAMAVVFDRADQHSAASPAVCKLIAVVGCTIQSDIQPVGWQWTDRPRADGNHITIGIWSKS